MDDGAAALGASTIGVRRSYARERMEKGMGKGTIVLFLALLLAGIGFTVFSLNRDIENANAPSPCCRSCSLVSRW